MSETYFDVLIVGAGLSGIDAAYRLQTECPGKTYAILEGRSALGGTWDLFRYPGIRSDSDMFTLGYPFRPWDQPDAIAAGPAILSYISDTAREYEIDRHIHYDHQVTTAAWSSESARWTVQATSGDGSVRTFTCRFLYLCSGYYSYKEGYTPEFPGRDRFQGTVVHPQQWPENLDYSGKKVVVIGSGATAVTLVPAMVPEAGHVTMLQRSPTYVGAVPGRDPMVARLRLLVSPSRVAKIARWRNLALGAVMWQFVRRFPKSSRSMLQRVADKRLAGSSVSADPHFVPDYDPWDQRLCLAPDGDLFEALKSDRASIVTDKIAQFTSSGIQLESGRHLDADIIVTATGLQVVAAGEIDLEVDGRKVSLHDKWAYRGVMYSDMPNFAWCIGYTNASWTLRADLSSRYVCRLLNYLDEHGYDFAAPSTGGKDFRERPFLNLKSGYVLRAQSVMPKQSDRAPWQVRQNYLLDFGTMRFGNIGESMVFGRRSPKSVSLRA
ncbi:NAD(P)/FAD-dependent oxidoreductase [Nocardia sp. BSTN01]|uniref:flavin-containing monooxygenase n=1 Tax=Nocardia sp. BSTN01 TaxID=2783665 RepID=UPI00188F0304|nr:NAD(P)/FAD-dependent oxidoreductase [Nocardia sp. BSTN01]MBF5000506.1 NAD(P)/FAD-dependent oxidoreductase [Nocardia sp. BSTN01]